MDSPDASTPQHLGPPPARWFQRVLPVTAIAVVLVALVALFSPGFRQQLRLSATRQAQPYVELFFSEAPRGSLSGVQVTCARIGKTVLADFVVRSHLTERSGVAYEVSVDPTTGTLPKARKSGIAELEPGASAKVRETIPLPVTQPYVLTVSLPGREQELRARCASGRASS